VARNHEGVNPKPEITTASSDLKSDYQSNESVALCRNFFHDHHRCDLPAAGRCFANGVQTSGQRVRSKQLLSLDSGIDRRPTD
jgi:hypothetical protein